MNQVEKFNEIRTEQNKRISEAGSLVLNRYFNLDTHVFSANALDAKTKELMGLCVSLALRCDDCVKYHIGSAIENGANEKELIETFEIASLIGGTIVIPHLRRAFEYMDDYFENRKSSN